jgi:hypothetical protein
VRLGTIQPCRGVPDEKLGNSLLSNLVRLRSHGGTRLRLVVKLRYQRGTSTGQI